jgi:transcriptional regulator of met regulon
MHAERPEIPEDADRFHAGLPLGRAVKTPYDDDRKLRRRELDDIRHALVSAETQLSVFAGAIVDADARLRREREARAADPPFDVSSDAAVRRSEMIRLARELARLEDEIERLRAALLVKFEALRPIEMASEDYAAAKRAEARRSSLERG